MLSIDSSKTAPQNSLNAKQSVLVVEDEDLIRDTIALALSEEGYDVVTAGDGRVALQQIQALENNNPLFPFDLLILDVMLPEINGLDLCRLLRYQGKIVPILILSAKASETDRVLGLEVGADDYLTKPFSLRELVARCRALMRRQNYSSQVQTTAKQYKDIILSTEECRVTVRNEEVTLSPKEFRLLELFMSYPRRVWSREQLIEQIWGQDFLGDTKTVDVHIRWLREKLEKDPSQPEYLVTVRGFGYRFG
jgi:two-component system, OmpR family, phosphate regulon response regulator PhoB